MTYFNQIPFEWIGCTCHQLELTPKSALEKQHTVVACRRIVGEYDKSTAKTAHLHVLQAEDHIKIPLSLVREVTTRWWSTYTMLLRILKLKKYLVGMVAMGWTHEALTSLEWKQVESLVFLLNPFKTVQVLLEASKEVTISLVPDSITQLREHLEYCSKNLHGIMGLALALLNDFNERWGSGVGDTVTKTTVI